MQEELTLDNKEEKEELYEHHRITVDKGQELLRMDKYLMNILSNISRNKIQQAAKANCILVNGKAEKSNYRVKPNDLIIINKPAGLVVHPAYGNYTGTLVNALTYRFLDKKTKEGEPVRPLLVHRIDKNTSGIMIVAKSEWAQMKLAKNFFDHTIDRKYYALVWGDFKEDEGTIIANVGRNPKDRMVMTTFPDGDAGKHAVTHW